MPSNLIHSKTATGRRRQSIIDRARANSNYNATPLITFQFFSTPQPNKLLIETSKTSIADYAANRISSNSFPQNHRMVHMTKYESMVISKLFEWDSDKLNGTCNLQSFLAKVLSSVLAKTVCSVVVLDEFRRLQRVAYNNNINYNWNEFLNFLSESSNFLLPDGLGIYEYHRQLKEKFSDEYNATVMASQSDSIDPVINNRPDTALFNTSKYFEKSQLQIEAIKKSLHQPDPSICNRIDEYMLQTPTHLTSTNKWEEEMSVDEEDSEEEVTETEIQPNLELMKESRIKKLLDMRFKALTSEEKQLIKNSLYHTNESQLIIEKYNAPITGAVMSCLCPGNWMNDEIINFYMNMLQDRDEALSRLDSTRKKSHFFNSFFMEKMLVTDKGYSYSNIKRWSKKFDIFELDKIYFPVNLGNTHWTLAVVFMTDKKIQYFDSMGSTTSKYIESLMKYIIDEGKAKKGIEVNREEWTLIKCDSSNTPQQRNGFDCGVFSMLFADFISDGIPLHYLSQEHIPMFREKICLAVTKGELSYEIVHV